MKYAHQFVACFILLALYNQLLLIQYFVNPYFFVFTDTGALIASV